MLSKVKAGRETDNCVTGETWGRQIGLDLFYSSLLCRGMKPSGPRVRVGLWEPCSPSPGAAPEGWSTVLFLPPRASGEFIEAS